MYKAYNIQNIVSNFRNMQAIFCFIYSFIYLFIFLQLNILINLNEIYQGDTLEIA